MSVTAAAGFRASGVAAGLKPDGTLDLALVVNDGPSDAAAALFTTNRCKANPVLWSERAIADGRARAVVLNSGGANVFTGPAGFQVTHATAEEVARLNDCGAFDVLVASTGAGGPYLDQDAVLRGVAAATANLSRDGHDEAAAAILTSDSGSKQSAHRDDAGWAIGGMAKGTGMLAPSLATMLVVLTTDADVSFEVLDASLRAAAHATFERIDSDGCRSTNDTVAIMASGASGVVPDLLDFQRALTRVCADLATQLVDDADDASHVIAIAVQNAASDDDALEVARAVSRSALAMAAIQQESADWFRILAQVGTTTAAFDPSDIDVGIQGEWVCRGSQQAGHDPIAWARQVEITIDLKAGSHRAILRTSDLNPALPVKNSR